MGILFVVGWVLSVVGFMALSNYEERRRQDEFDRETENHFVALQQMLGHHDQLLTVVQNLFHASGQVGQELFHGLLQDLIAADSGIRAIHWVPFVDGAGRGDFETPAGTSNQDPLPVLELDASNRLVPAAARKEYFPVQFVEPASSVHYARGLDLGALPRERAMLEQARDTDQTQAMFLSLQGEKGTNRNGLVVVMPVYRPGTQSRTVEERRASLMGFVHSVFDVPKVLENYTSHFPAWGLNWVLYERLGGENRVVHSHLSHRFAASGPLREWHDVGPGLRQEKRFPLGDLELVVIYRPSAAWMAQHVTHFGRYFLLVGGAVTCLVCLYFTTLLQGGERIRQQVAIRTAELGAAKARLEESEARFRSYMDNSPAVAWLKDDELRYRYLNAAFKTMFRVTTEYQTGKLDADWLPADVAEKLRDHDQEVLRTGRPSETIEQVPTPDGRMRHWLVTKFPFPGPGGRKWVGGMGFEISERIEAEQALRESQQRLELAIQGAELGVWDRNLQTGATVFNTRWAEMLGYSLGEITPNKSTWEGLLHPEDKARVLAELHAHLEGRTPHYQCEYRLQTRQGDWKWISAAGRVVERDVQGKPLRFAGTHRDITAQKRAEAVRSALFTVGRRLSEVQTLSDAARVILNTAAELFPWEAAYLDLYDASQDKLTTLLALDTLQGQRRELPPAPGSRSPSPISRRVIEHGPQLIVRGGEKPDPQESVPFGDASRHSTSLMYVPLRRGGRVIGVLSVQSYKVQAYASADLAVLQALADYAGGAVERIRAEEALRESQRFNQRITETSPLLTYVFDLAERRNVFVNRSITDQLGYTPEQIARLGPDFLPRLIHPEDAKAQEAIRTRWETASDQDILTTEYRMKDAEGRWRCFLNASAVFLRAEDGRVRQIVGTIADITERRHAQEALSQERNLLRTLIDHLPDCIYVKDCTGAYVLTNAANLRLLGLAEGEEIMGMTPHDFFPAEVANLYVADDRAVLKTGQPLLDREEPFTTRTGETGWFLTSKFPLRDAHGQIIGMVGVSRDVTEAKRAAKEQLRLQRKLEEAQKLESLGVLAGGVAHDFNNLLTGVLGNASLAKMLLPQGSPIAGCVDEIEKASVRAADLCKQMLAYAGKGRLIVKKLDLSALIEESAPLLRLSVSKTAVLQFHLARNLPAVVADATQLQQILMNLVINASEAIGDQHGLITVGTGRMRADQAYLNGTYLAPELPEGDYAYLEVSDTGCGMDKETLAKIFDPFFTTKFLGRGLGLAAVLGIVRGHNGTLKVYSEPGRGSSFRLLLPCAEGATESARTEASSSTNWRGSGVVLVVDDEDTVRTTLARLLESFGFQVRLAADGAEGVEVFRSHADSLVLVLLDLTMPKKDGVEAFREMRCINNAARVLLMSGFSEQEAVSRFTGTGLAGFIQKPFTADALRRKIQEVLDR